MTDSPREIYLKACAEIATHFADLGFQYLKSGPCARKKLGGFTYQIGFQSSHNNSIGVTVKLWVAGTVFSKKLKSWRSSYPELQSTDVVAGGQIGNLVTDSSWYDWNLADPQTRSSTIASVVKAIESIAIPYFEQFDDLDSMVSRLQESDIPSMPIYCVIEYLMCFADRAAARIAATQYLIRNPRFVRSYQRSFARYAEHGLEYSRPSGEIARLALASHLFDFGDLSRGVTDNSSQ